MMGYALFFSVGLGLFMWGYACGYREGRDPMKHLRLPKR